MAFEKKSVREHGPLHRLMDPKKSVKIHNVFIKFHLSLLNVIILLLLAYYKK